MKSYLAISLLSLVTLLSSGCGEGHAEKTGTRPAPEPAAIYKAGHGLRFTSFAREFNRIAVAEFATRVPAAAVLRTVEGTFVYVQNGEWFLRTPVTLKGAEGTDGFALKEGLYEGDLVVMSGVRAVWLAELHALRAGQACAHEG